MNKDAVLSFIKKNLVSLICGIVAIVAVVLLFYPIGGMVDQLTTDAQAQAGDFATLDGFIHKTRKKPITDPNQTDPGELVGADGRPLFPNAATIKAGNDAVALWKADSEKMFADVTRLNHAGHTMLVPDELPKEVHETTPFHFAQVYRLALSTDPAVHGVPTLPPESPVAVDPTLAEVKAVNLQNDILHGALPPTKDQIQQAASDLWHNTYEIQIVTQNGKAVNMDQLGAAFHAEAARLPQKLKNDIARKYKIYVEKEAFTFNTAIQPDVKSSIQDIWYAQMGLWIQQDISTAIAEANSGSKNILDAEVKRLLSIQIPTPDKLYTFAPLAAGGSAQPGQFNVPAGDEKTAYPPIYTGPSVSGRYCNGMYDVVQFGLTVDVDSARVNQFIETLSNQRLITITNENEFAINPDAESANGYLYGSGSTVRLQLTGEILFLRSWTSSLMPDPVKVTLGLIQGQAGAPPGGGGMQGGMPGGGRMPPGGMGGPGFPQRPPMP